MKDIAIDRLELGKLYFKIVDFEQAIQQLKTGMQEAKDAREYSRWCQYLPLLLRIYAERMEFAEIAILKAELAEFETAGLLKATSNTHYTLGISACFEGKLDPAENYFSAALELSEGLLESAQARFGLCVVSSHRQRYEETLRTLNGLNDELRLSLLPDLRLATRLLMAVCRRSLGQFDQALEILGELQSQCRVEQNLFMSLSVLYCYGTVCQQMRDGEKARQYFEMVRSLLAPKDLRHLDVQIEKRLAELQPVFQIADQGVVTPEGKRVNFGNQFILKALLKRLAGQKGQSLNKEDLCQLLWKQDYNPLIHDNKIYVTIRRLRRLIEPSGKTPRYILSSPDGYLFNPNVEFRNLA